MPTDPRWHDDVHDIVNAHIASLAGQRRALSAKDRAARRASVFDVSPAAGALLTSYQGQPIDNIDHNAAAWLMGHPQDLLEWLEALPSVNADRDLAHTLSVAHWSVGSTAGLMFMSWLSPTPPPMIPAAVVATTVMGTVVGVHAGATHWTLRRNHEWTPVEVATLEFTFYRLIAARAAARKDGRLVPKLISAAEERFDTAVRQALHRARRYAGLPEDVQNPTRDADASESRFEIAGPFAHAV